MVAFLEAALCASLTALEKFGHIPALDYLDYDEAGITMAELNVWWREHKRKDAARREWEQHERERKEREAAEKIERQRILATLTPEQRRILGV